MLPETFHQGVENGVCRRAWCEISPIVDTYSVSGSGSASHITFPWNDLACAWKAFISTCWSKKISTPPFDFAKHKLSPDSVNVACRSEWFESASVKQWRTLFARPWPLVDHFCLVKSKKNRSEAHEFVSFYFSPGRCSKLCRRLSFTKGYYYLLLFFCCIFCWTIVLKLFYV